MALVGPSGAGKTTLFRLAYGAFTPEAGSVLVDGDDVAHLSGASLRRTRAKIAVIFQHHGLVERLSALRNVIAGTFGGRGTVAAIRSVVVPTTAEREAAVAALEHVGLADRANDAVFGLSGGQRQRVAVARAIVARARIVLADEPAASLDPALARDTVAFLQADARERGATLVCTLHQPELTSGFDRVVEISGGRVASDLRRPRP